MPSQVSALMLLFLLPTTAVDNADEEGQLMKSLKEDIANAPEHPRTVLTESFGIACFTTAGCTGAAKRADAVAADEAGTPQPFQMQCRDAVPGYSAALQCRGVQCRGVQCRNVVPGYSAALQCRGTVPQCIAGVAEALRDIPKNTPANRLLIVIPDKPSATARAL